MKLNQGAIPPNGYHFPVDFGVILKASSYDALIKEIVVWKTQNGLPIGDPAKDVDDYFCAKWPSACQPGESEQKMLQQNSNLLKQVNGWAATALRNTPQGGYLLVDQTIATQRLKACLECPFNRQWHTGCGTCMAATDTILIRLRQLRKITLDDSLLGCSINGFDNRTAIHMPLSAFGLTEEKKNDLPQNCWLKTETQ